MVIIGVDFQEIFIFPIDFNGFMQLWGKVGVILVSFWAHFGVILGL